MATIYSENADLAASFTPQGHLGDCPACVKAGLPVLLVRPGLASSTYAQSKQASLKPWLDKDTAPVVLSYSRYVMRTLRAGYVMAYYEKSHTLALKANNGWQAFRVDDGGYMTPHLLDALPMCTPEGVKPFTCQRTGAYAMAMLFVIPDAKNTGKVWVAYSDHPFSHGVRELYAQNAQLRSQRMTEIDPATGTSARGQPINEALINQTIADYDDELPDDALRGNPHPALALGEQPGIAQRRPERASDLMAQVQKLCQADDHPLSHVNIVCVPDAVGVTHEAAVLRSTLCNSASQWLNKQPDGHWRLQTALSIEGLLREVEARGEARKAQLLQYAGTQGQPITREAFEAQKQAGTLPADAQFEPNLIPLKHDPSTLYHDRRNGTVRLPSQRWVDAQTDTLKQDVLDKLEGSDDTWAFRQYLEQLNTLTQQDEQRRALLEPDFGGWLQSAPRQLVTEHDCDTSHRLDGLHYACIVSQVTAGGPLTEQSLNWYADFLTEKPDDKNNLLTRALLGNQAEFFESFKQGKIIKEAKTLFKIFEDAATAITDGKPLTVDQRLARRLSGFNTIVNNMPLLKLGLAGYGQGLVMTVAATVAALDKQSKLGAGLRTALTDLMQGIIAANAPAGVTAQRLQMSLSEARRWWRAQANALTERVHQADKQVRSVAVGGAMALDLVGRPNASSALIDVYVITRKTLPQHLSQLAAQGGKIADTMNALAKETALFLRDGAAPLSAAVGVLQILSLGKAKALYETGTQEERQKASFILLGSGLGLVGVSLELSEALAKQKKSTALARSLKIAAGSLGAAALAVDAVFAGMMAQSREKVGDADSAVMFRVQMAFFIGASVASGLVVAETAKWITLAGVGFSWTGWVLVLLAAGMTAGYIAALLQDTPTEEWVARSIWGHAADKWGSLKREQEALNKVLLGISFEFDYTQSLMHNLGNSATAADGGLFSGQQKDIYYKEARLRYLIPAALKDSMQWSVEIYLHSDTAIRHLIFSAGTGYPPSATRGGLEGTEQPEIIRHSPDLTVVTSQAERLLYPGASAVIKVYDDLSDGQLLIDQAIWVR